MAVLHLHTKLT